LERITSIKQRVCSPRERKRKIKKGDQAPDGGLVLTGVRINSARKVFGNAGKRPRRQGGGADRLIKSGTKGQRTSTGKM